MLEEMYKDSDLQRISGKKFHEESSLPFTDATLVKANPTTYMEELVKVTAKSGIEQDQFLKIYESEGNQKALDKDFEIYKILNINNLPAYLLQYKDQAASITSLAKHENFIQVINKLTK